MAKSKTINLIFKDDTYDSSCFDLLLREVNEKLYKDREEGDYVFQLSYIPGESINDMSALIIDKVIK